MNKRPELGNGQGRLDDRSWVYLEAQRPVRARRCSADQAIVVLC